MMTDSFERILAVRPLVLIMWPHMVNLLPVGLQSPHLDLARFQQELAELEAKIEKITAYRSP